MIFNAHCTSDDTTTSGLKLIPEIAERSSNLVTEINETIKIFDVEFNKAEIQLLKKLIDDMKPKYPEYFI